MQISLEAILRHEVLKTTAANFEQIALQVFNFQYENNPLYREYCILLRKMPNNVNYIHEIPFLPIAFFKNKIIKTTQFEEEIIFESSGTTGSINSKHFIKEKKMYEESYLKGFSQFYGNEKDYCIIGLLPSYLEKQGSSLVYMVDDLIKKSTHKNSGFYLYEYDKLKEILLENEEAKQPTLLIGVTYALIDFAEQNELQLQHTIIMETGGMKGRKKELTRAAVHNILSTKLGVKKIHSEYGMTELLSQAYSKADGIFNCSSSMRVLIRDEDDPFKISALVEKEKEFTKGGVNIIDLANLYSCSFIATDDAGKLYTDGSFEVLGRLENSDIRGCGLMVAE
jgi:phenylacetate-coenzyme A ligase PaaK-like adenylate-forming protein